MSKDNEENAEAAKELFNLLKMAECCVAMMDGKFGGLDVVGRSRLSKNLLGLILSQVGLHLQQTSDLFHKLLGIANYGFLILAVNFKINWEF